MLKKKEWKDQNIMPKFDRQLTGLIILGLTIYMIISITSGKIYIPGKHNNGLLMTGISAKICISALCSVILSYLANILNHYNRNKSKIWFFYFGKALSFLAGFLFLLSLVIQFFSQK